MLLFCRYSFQPLHPILNARSPSNGIEPTYGKAIDVSRPRCHLNYQPTVLERGQQRVSRRGFLEQRVAHNLLRKAESIVAPTRSVGRSEQVHVLDTRTGQCPELLVEKMLIRLNRGSSLRVGYELVLFMSIAQQAINDT